MKRILVFILAAVIVLSLFMVGAGATDGDTAADVGAEAESAAESVFEGAEAEQESAADTVLVPETSTESESEAYIDGDILDDIISGSESKAQAVIKLAEAMGITLEDAEALIDKFITFGDAHFEDSDLWSALKQDVNEHPDKWIIVALAALAFVALIVFLIRSVIKNTLTQTNTKIKLAAIEEQAKGVEQQGEDLKLQFKDLKEEADEMRETLDTVLQLLMSEAEAVGSLKSNSDTSLKLSEESAFQILTLLNIAMGRQMPVVTPETRKLWYENSIAKLKEKIAEGDKSGGGQNG
jgi:uncharacterized protein YoxC